MMSYELFDYFYRNKFLSRNFRSQGSGCPLKELAAFLLINLVFDQIKHHNVFHVGIEILLLYIRSSNKCINIYIYIYKYMLYIRSL